MILSIIISLLLYLSIYRHVVVARDDVWIRSFCTYTYCISKYCVCTAFVYPVNIHRNNTISDDAILPQVLFIRFLPLYLQLIKANCQPSSFYTISCTIKSIKKRSRKQRQERDRERVDEKKKRIKKNKTGRKY